MNKNSLTAYIQTADTFKNSSRSEIESINKLVKKRLKQYSTSFNSDVLIHNRVTFPKITQKQLKGVKEPILQTAQFKNFKDNLYSSRDETTLKKNIRYCRMFYLYLRLVLECEQRNLTISKKDKPFKLNRSKFKDFNLDELFSYKQYQFDPFMREYKHLFTLQPIKLIKSYEDLDDDSFLVSIPRKSSMSAVKREIENLLSEKLVGESAKFVFSDRITPYATLHYEYNSLVLALNQNTRNQIMNVCNEKYKNVRDFQKKKANSEEYETENVIYSFESAVSRTLRYGRERMYRLCDGVFP
jgi:hypothetical protein